VPILGSPREWQEPGTKRYRIGLNDHQVKTAGLHAVWNVLHDVNESDMDVGERGETNEVAVRADDVHRVWNTRVID
jgi:hypothetical protein